jgi:hypothetical protein
MMSEDNERVDSCRRQTILNFVETLQTAYYRKDIDLLTKMYGDDDWIITGKAVKQTKSINSALDRDSFFFRKKEYINKLLSIFKNNSKINVDFSEIEVVQHPEYPDLYGISFKQSWNTDNYSDTGYCFFLIGFKDGQNMQIHVRTWQPDKPNGLPLSEVEKIKFSDFVIQE